MNISIQLRNKARNSTNGLLNKFGVRLVSSHWGPRGYISSFRQLQKTGFKPKYIYDIGASDGSWSLALQKVFGNSHYILFEPLPEHYKALREICQFNDSMSFKNYALGSSRGKLELYQRGGMSSFLELGCSKGSVFEANVSTIDNLVESGECPLPELIKADIQGFELEMLKGCENTLKTCSVLFVEVSWLQIYERGPMAGEVIGFLAERGFHVYDICSYAMRPYDQRLTQSDILFVHERTGLFDEKRWK